MNKYGELLGELLKKRGILDEEMAEVFLNPKYDRDLHDPFLMRDMERACVRIFKAIEAKEKIVVYADYDCDGVPGAVVLKDLFQLVNYDNFEVYIPERNSEGYGLNKEALSEFKKKEVKLLITVDLGITAIEAVKEAKKCGIDVIITDHHLPKEILPEAYAILNPKVDDYPEKMLCGAGVAFKLAQGFLKKYGEYFEVRPGAEKWMLDMAGLATLSDMVPLTGENRAIAYFGMKVFRKSRRPGLQKLLAQLRIDQKTITEDDIAFMVTPRLNAASRMDSPMRAYELLATEDEREGDVLAKHLTKINDERKKIVATIMRDINKKIQNRPLGEVIVIGHNGWRIGILGLIAGKILDEYKRPVFVWGKDENDCIKGSCRSNGAVSVVELMNEVKDSFIEFGGHELAGGFTVHNDKIHFLEEVLSQAFHKVKRPMNEKLEALHDLKFGLDRVNLNSWKEIERLSPFGLANPKPIFLFEGVKVEKVRRFGKNGSGEHLEVIFRDDNARKSGVSFFSNPESFNGFLAEGLNVNLLATLDLSRFRGREELRLRIREVI